MNTESNAVPPVGIVLSVHNGGAYLAEQLRSIQAQTHTDWLLWIRDDGSTDGSFEIASEFAETDGRVRPFPRDGRKLGAAPCFGWLLERVPAETRYVFCCDADDVWLPHKIERSLAAMLEAEGRGAGPVLVHTDLCVVDEHLEIIAPSFWSYTKTDPTATRFRRLLVANVATGPTLLLNRALLDRVLPIPSESPHHDWWIALVAEAFGRLVALPEPTVLYRRHGANVTGGFALPGSGGRTVALKLWRARSQIPIIRRWILATARQAGAFLDRYGEELPPESLSVLRELAELPQVGFMRRKRKIMKCHLLPEQGWISKLGILLRA